MTPDIFLDYVRFICYGLVIASALASINRRRFSKCILIADALFALLLALASIYKSTLFLGFDTRDAFLTPAVLMWAIIHYYNLLKG